MIRRLLVVFAVLAATLLLAAPVSADGATSSTQNFHGAFPPFHVDATCGAASGTVFATGNAVFHITVNAAGDTWVTTTQEGWFTLTPDTGTVTYSGHFAVWFGASLNKNNTVLHDVLNIRATGSDGSIITVNAVDHLSISASGQVNMFMACH
jgi:hypothetical protein